MENLDAFFIEVQEDDDIVLLALLGPRSLGNYTSIGFPSW